MTSTRSFTPTRQGNPCLVCGDIKGKCRQTPEDLNLCMESSGVLPGFKYLGQTKDGFWAKYLIDDGTEQNKEDRESSAQRFRYWIEQQQLRTQRTAAEAQRHVEALPALERESFAPRVRLYNQLLNQLPLHPDDRADLHRRGITNEQIKAWGVRSVEQWQPLTQELSHALPGLSLDGRHLFAEFSLIAHQKLMCVIERNQDIQFSVSQKPLKRLTQAENKSLIDQTKEVIANKGCFKRKKTPTGKKEF